ncbi:MAG: hypothetical protein SH856_06645 [Flavobacteriales bacterium]|nr:hypothetical protein [Flavobacteriales bacterium]
METDMEGSHQFLLVRIERRESEIFINDDDDGVLAGCVQLYPIFSSTRMRRFWLLNDFVCGSQFSRQGYFQTVD